MQETYFPQNLGRWALWHCLILIFFFTKQTECCNTWRRAITHLFPSARGPGDNEFSFLAQLCPTLLHHRCFDRVSQIFWHISSLSCGHQPHALMSAQRSLLKKLPSFMNVRMTPLGCPQEIFRKGRHDYMKTSLCSIENILIHISVMVKKHCWRARRRSWRHFEHMRHLKTSQRLPTNSKMSLW